MKNGDLINVDGKEATLEGSWGQGAHKAFKLSDGRVILDLDKAVATGAAKVMPTSSIPKSNIVIPMPPVVEPKKLTS